VLDAVTIVGASLAGLSAAETLRNEGFEGRLAVVDAETHTPHDRPPLSKQVLSGAWEPERAVLAAARADLDLEWYLGRRATALDVAAHAVTLDDGEVLAADAVVIATGATPRRLPSMDGVDGVHVLRTIDDCLAIRGRLDAGATRVVVVGAGFIGAEVAATCRQLGCDVTILEALPVPLERALGPVMGPLVTDLHRDHGVDVRLGTAVDGPVVGDAGTVTGVRLGVGEVIPADVVVVGIGVVPSTGWLESSGLALADGVVVDAALLAAPGVVAAGDVARFPSRRFGADLRIEHWENAMQMGPHAARTLLAEAAGEDPTGRPPFDPVPWFWSDQYDRKIQLAGRSGADYEVEVVIGSTDERRFVALYGQDGLVRGVLGWNRPRHVMQLRRLVEESVPWADGLAEARALA
jgi:NADPH-dependent 2,4-dienoyl-CoA reductase/sulfur reductase-like enzyme